MIKRVRLDLYGTPCKSKSKSSQKMFMTEEDKDVFIKETIKFMAFKVMKLLFSVKPFMMN